MIHRKIEITFFISVLITAVAVQAEDVSLELQMPNHTYSPGMICKLDLRIQNSGPDYMDSKLFVALTIGTGEYWFYPSWRYYPDDLDFEPISILQNDDYIKAIIQEFEWPEGAGSFSGASFLAAVLSNNVLISNVASFDFEWTETNPPTPDVSPTATQPAATVTATSTPITETPTPTPTNPAQTPTFVPPDFVYIPSGTFQMGSPDDEMCRYDVEGPVHSVTISHAFFMQTTEVTQQQWVDIFESNPSVCLGMNRPVENVTWYDCCIFCNRISQSEGLTPCYYSDDSFTTVLDGTPPVMMAIVYWNQNANGYRLPTEAEWEYVGRAGTTTAYNSGEDNTDCFEDPNLDPLGWYYYNSDSVNGRETHPVGLKQANAWGLFDMHGNVYEWCWDIFNTGYYSSSPSIDPTGPSSGSLRVERGGAWNYSAGRCRIADRNFALPKYHGSSRGFRVLRNAP